MFIPHIIEFLPEKNRGDALQELADIAEISPVTLWRIMTLKPCNPKLSVATAISKALGRTIDEVFPQSKELSPKTNIQQFDAIVKTKNKGVLVRS